MARLKGSCFAVAGLLLPATLCVGQGQIGKLSGATEYTFSFPDAVHHVMQVEAEFHAVPRGAFRVHMSRSSPGRYAAFEFAANVFEERFTDGAGKPLTVTKTDPRTWSVQSDDGTVHVAYKLFGDRVDGTFMAVDTTHAHLNMPATVMWADGFDERPVRVRFVLPPALGWKVATQLYPTTDALTFTAPNFQYLMDSPAELSDFRMQTFTVPALQAGGKAQTLRVAVHSDAKDAEVATYYAGVQKLVREEQAVFGELADYEPGYYTFLEDALPWANGDGMEHRNSTVMTGKKLSLGTAAHEFFHSWNVERIRPEGLEPFNFRDVNMSGEMFLAEGFTQYYGNLAMLRAGLEEKPDELRAYAGDLGYVLSAPGARYRSAVDMSRLAPLVDGANDDLPRYWRNDFVSYYSFGDVIALGLDLSLRARTDGRVSLDDFMRAMWRAYGKPGGPSPGLVGRPYTLADVEEQLGKVSGDPAFAADFVRRYIVGTEKLDYAPLLLRAGFVLRHKAGGSLGPLRLEKNDAGVMVVKSPTLIGSPVYRAGIDLDDEIGSMAGNKLATPDDLEKLMKGRPVGESVEIVYRERGVEKRATVVLAESQELEIVPVEKAGGVLSAEQGRFRAAWLGSKA